MSGFKIGFTGSQDGMTTAQMVAVWKLIKGEAELHHGDCIGADAIAHGIAKGLGLAVVVHPPSNDSKRAFCVDADVVLAPKPYLERNHDIVDATDVLVATPSTRHERLRSGTWATIRYARRRGKPLWIFGPDGSQL